MARVSPALLALALLIPATCHAYSPHLLWTRPLEPNQVVKGQGGWLFVQPSGNLVETQNPPGFVIPWESSPAPDEPSPPLNTAITGKPWDLLALRSDSGAVALKLHGAYSRYKASGGKLLAARSVIVPPGMVVEVWDLPAGKLRTHVSASCLDPGQLSLSDVREGRFYFADDHGKHLYDLHRQRVVRKWPSRGETGMHSDPLRYLRDLLPVGDRFYYGDDHTIGIARRSDGGGWYYYCDTNPVLADEHGVIGVGGWKDGIVSLRPDGTPYFVGRTNEGHTDWTTTDHEYAPAFLSGRLLIVGAKYLQEVPPPQSRKDDSPTQRWLSGYLVAFDRFTGRAVWKRPMWPGSYALYGNRIAVMAGHGEPDQYRYRLEVYDLRGRRLSRGQQVWGEGKPQVLPAGEGFALVTATELRCYR